jgi:hypothetical protein
LARRECPRPRNKVAPRMSVGCGRASAKERGWRPARVSVVGVGRWRAEASAREGGYVFYLDCGAAVTSFFRALALTLEHALTLSSPAPPPAGSRRTAATSSSRSASPASTTSASAWISSRTSWTATTRSPSSSCEHVFPLCVIVECLCFVLQFFSLVDFRSFARLLPARPTPMCRTVMP